jgi:integrase
MPRKTIVPKYLLHKRSGRAYTYHRLIDTKDHRLYLGRYGSPEAAAAFSEVCRSIAALEGGATMTPRPKLGANPTLYQLALAYDDYAKRFYRRGDELSREYDGMWGAVKILLEQPQAVGHLTYGDVAANQFGPRLLRSLLESMGERDYCRTFINKTNSRIKRFFAWACREELIDKTVYQGLLCVKGLVAGELGVRESEAVRPAPLAWVNALLPYVPPVIGDMMQVQYLCATRPDEVCRMRGCDIDRSGDIWLYQPVRHKNGWRGKTLLKAIPVAAQSIIAARLGDGGYLFPPCEGLAWSLAQRSVYSPGRTTKAYPSELRQREKLKALRRQLPKRKSAGPHYTTDSYRRAISYGFKRAGRQGVELERFTPNQLRHAIVTFLSAHFGQQKAQVYAGHDSFDTTSIYNEKTTQEMLDVARQFDSLLARAS